MKTGGRCLDCEWTSPPNALLRDSFDHQQQTGHSGFLLVDPPCRPPLPAAAQTVAKELLK